METHRLIEALIRLTKPASSLGLNSCLIEQVKGLFEPTSVTLYDLIDEDGRREFTTANLNHAQVRNVSDAGRVSAFPLVQDDILVQCVTSGERVVSPKKDGVVYPIRAHEGVTALLATRYDLWPAHEARWMAYLLEGYGNQRRLLYTLERDALTQLLNRQTFDRLIWEVIRRVTEEAAGSDASAGQIYLCLADIDHFKEVNDTYGHLYGDEVLLLFSQIISRHFRHTDLSFRYGGEEFCVVLPDVRAAQAMRILERFRLAVEDFAFPRIGRRTVSIGLTRIRRGDSPGALFGRADKALYFAKENGRNQLHCYEELSAAGRFIDDHEEITGGIELF